MISVEYKDGILKCFIFKGMPESGGALAEGFKARLVEFCTFERNFEECISRSATRTRFHQHVQGAQNIVDSFLAEASNLSVCLIRNLRVLKPHSLEY